MNGSSKLFGRLVALAVLCIAFAASGTLADQHTEKDKAVTAGKAAATSQGDAAHQAAMAEMMKYANPGKPHEQLKAMEGTWAAVVKSWTGPGEPLVSKGTMVNKMILGGRYLEGRYAGNFMDQPFEGYSLTGYDMKKNELISLWIDNLSTTWMAQNGNLSADGKELVVKGTADGPDGKPSEFKSVTKVVDANKHVFTMTTMMEGKEMPMMEITYTR